ncbi:MAG: hypothetical protein K6E85_10430 [Lachnospiraceae bacterium]|nr:hypothetical protein [Lachnospiraceae bacterium]
MPLKFMFCCNGDKDIAYAEHTDIMGKVLPICPQIKKAENYDFFVIPGGVHDMRHGSCICTMRCRYFLNERSTE